MRLLFLIPGQPLLSLKKAPPTHCRWVGLVAPLCDIVKIQLSVGLAKITAH